MLKRMSLGVVFCLLVSWPLRGWSQHSQYWLPVETGMVESHLDLQFHYSSMEYPGMPGSNVDLNLIFLSLEGQYAIKDTFEIGVNVPFLMKGQVNAGDKQTDETQFGDVMLNLKGQLFGGDTLGVALYTNVQLPTHSGDASRERALLIPGVAASVKLLGFRFGGSLQGLWGINGKGDDLVALGFDGYGGYSLLGVLTLEVALSFFNSVKPDSEMTAFAITPGATVDLFDILRAGIACRIAANDDGKLLYGGTAALLLHGGISF